MQRLALALLLMVCNQEGCLFIVMLQNEEKISAEISKCGIKTLRGA